MNLPDRVGSGSESRFCAGRTGKYLLKGMSRFFICLFRGSRGSNFAGGRGYIEMGNAVRLTLVSLLWVACGLGWADLAPPKNGGVYVVAHRGAHIGIPENTLAAYAKAIELGCDFVEIDVRTTKDGHFVSVHNSSVDAYTEGVTGKVAEMTLDEIRALDVGKKVGPDWAGTRVPTLDEILALCKGKIGIYLDLKEGDPVAILAKIREYDMQNDVIWYASWEEQQIVRAQCAECHIMPDPGPEENLAKLLETFPGVKVVASMFKFCSATFVQTCKDAGAIVIMDESEPSCWEESLSWGLQGIQTDHPEDLIKFLKERAMASK